ncbi:hypothetical protein ALAU109921_06235 [Alteromonas australica]
MVWGVALPLCKTFEAVLFGVVRGVFLVNAWQNRKSLFKDCLVLISGFVDNCAYSSMENAKNKPTYCIC